MYEPHICEDCGIEYQKASITIHDKCKKCKQREYNKVNNKLKPDELKKPYPLDANDKKRRWNRIRKEHNKCLTREDLNQHYDKCFAEIYDLGIMEWIVDRRVTADKVKNPGNGNPGRPKNDAIKKALPDTRVMNE